jgi:hypothetical protein
MVGAILLEQKDKWAVQRARDMYVLWNKRRAAERTILVCWFDVLIQAKDI